MMIFVRPRFLFSLSVRIFCLDSDDIASQELQFRRPCDVSATLSYGIRCREQVSGVLTEHIAVPTQAVPVVRR